MRYIKNNISYFCAYLLLFIAMVSALLLCLKAELHLALNAYHRPWLDVLMRAFSYLAQWPIYVLMAIFFLIIPLLRLIPSAFSPSPLALRLSPSGKSRIRFALYYIASELTATLITRIIKLSTNMPRPATFFADNPAFQQIIVEGVRLHSWHSFPSGHTQTFFVCATALALYFTSRSRLRPSPSAFCLSPLALLLFATIGAYSRIYLSQHFLLDVCVGSLIGVLVPVLLFPLYLRFDSK